MNVIFRMATQLACAHFSRLPQSCSWAAACLSVLIPLTTWAQSADRDPLNAQPTAPPISYQSAFSDYKPFQDPELMPWKTANEVVREFGGMAGMGGMSDGKNSDNTDAKPGGSEQVNLPAKPAHDMSNMKPATPTPASKKPATPASKPADMQSMPGHDMRKMQPAPAAPVTKSPPMPAKPPASAPMPGHSGMSH